MSDVKHTELDLIQPPTSPQGSQADMDAQRTWQETGYVPMAYVQEQLRQGLSSGQTITELVLASIESHRRSEEEAPAPVSNRSGK
jgi:hypothetical protein